MDRPIPDLFSPGRTEGPVSSGPSPYVELLQGSVTEFGTGFRQPSIDFRIAFGTAIPGIVGTHCLQLQSCPLALVAISINRATQGMTQAFRSNRMKLKTGGGAR